MDSDIEPSVISLANTVNADGVSVVGVLELPLCNFCDLWDSVVNCLTKNSTTETRSH